VQEVERTGERITVRGHRRIIAYVGAALVCWEPVPADQSVHVPSLEDALLGLLNGDQRDQGEQGKPAAAIPAGTELIGGRR
jgi:hypothetical protein